MSVFWRTDHVGSDGDFIRGQITVSYWNSPEDFKADLDEQMRQMRADVCEEYARMNLGIARDSG